MDKIIIRNKLMRPGVVSNYYHKIVFRELAKDDVYTSKEELIKDYGLVNLVKKLFEEDVDAVDLESSSIYKSYLSVMQSEKDNDDFKIAYKFRSNYAVHFSGHIYLYHLIPVDPGYSDALPWFYVDGELFIGHVWLESPKETLDDLDKMPMLDFLEKYHGFC